MLDNMSKKDFVVLDALKKGNGIPIDSVMKAIPLKSLNEILESNRISMTSTTLYRIINKLLDTGYICKGLNIKNSKTYYISEKGLNFINEIINTKN